MTFRLFQSNLTELKQFFLFSTSQSLSCNSWPLVLQVNQFLMVHPCVFSVSTEHIFILCHKIQVTRCTPPHMVVFFWLLSTNVGQIGLKKGESGELRKRSFTIIALHFSVIRNCKYSPLKPQNITFFTCKVSLFDNREDETQQSSLFLQKMLYFFSYLPFISPSVKCFSCEWVVWICNVWLENVLLCTFLLIIYT